MDSRAPSEPDSAHHLEYAAFCRHIRGKTGLDLLSYKQTQMERRIRAMADRRQVAGLDEFWRLLNQNPDALSEFLDRVTINVSEFLRNPERWDELRRWLIPELLKVRRQLNLWSAGCSYGAEPYSLRMLLEDGNLGHGHRISATDIDVRILEKARQGLYAPADLKNVSGSQKARFFVAEGADFRVRQEVRDSISFTHHDLLRSAFPRDTDLVLCRNVIIYFSDDAKSLLFQRFSDALRPGGYLLLGNTERVPEPQRFGLVQERPFFYQRSEVHR